MKVSNVVGILVLLFTSSAFAGNSNGVVYLCNSASVILSEWSYEEQAHSGQVEVVVGGPAVRVKGHVVRTTGTAEVGEFEFKLQPRNIDGDEGYVDASSTFRLDPSSPYSMTETWSTNAVGGYFFNQGFARKSDGVGPTVSRQNLECRPKKN